MTLSKKESILAATTRVISNQGVGNLTLDAVAAEASVSKGGLLYHYGTKDELISALNKYVIGKFRELIDKHLIKKKTYHEAYLLATLDTLQGNEKFNITTSLLAAIATNPEALDLWREEYDYLNEKLTEEHYKTEYSLLVKTVCDGLWFAKLFGFRHVNEEDGHIIIAYLIKLLEEGEM